MFIKYNKLHCHQKHAINFNILHKRIFNIFSILRYATIECFVYLKVNEVGWLAE